MDIRIEIIQSVTNMLINHTDIDTIDRIQDYLTIKFNELEMYDRCTEVAVIEESTTSIFKKFIATKRIEGAADSTIKRYIEINKAMLNFINKPLKEITTYDLRFYLSYKRQEGKVSNRTLDGMRRCYSSFFAWLSAEGFIDKNPCLALSQIKYRKEVKKPYSATDMEKIREACTNERDLALVEFLYCTGCRVTEVSLLNITDINFNEMECVVLGKGNKERVVYLSEVAAMHLKRYLDNRTDLCDALFVGKGGKRLTKNGIEAIIRKLGGRANVTKAHPHRYRRTLATNLLDRGMNIQDVATILGHADLKTTQVYCYISQSNIKSAYNKFAV